MHHAKLGNSLFVFLFTFFLFKFGECACPLGYRRNLGECYRVYDNLGPTTFADAQRQCENDGTHLLYIRDCNQFSSILRYIIGLDLNNVGTGLWIGATDEEEEGAWIWGNGYPVLMGVPFWGTTGEYWDPEPNGRQNENCAQLSNSDQYYLHDENCEGETGIPFCHIENEITENDSDFDSMVRKVSDQRYQYEDVTCPENFTTYIGQSCFFFGNNLTRASYENAKSYCEEIGGQLPILKDCVEYQALVQEIERNYREESGSSFWISATDNGIEGNWIWGDYSSMDSYPPFWGSANGIPEPNGGTVQNCGVLYRDDRYYFHDVSCTSGTTILCQASAVSTNRK